MAVLTAIAVCGLLFWLHNSISGQSARARVIDFEPDVPEQPRLPTGNVLLKTYLAHQLDELECSSGCNRCHMLDRHRRRLVGATLSELRGRCEAEGADLDATCDSETITLASPQARLRILDDGQLVGPIEASGWTVEEHHAPAFDMSVTYINLRRETPQKKENQRNASIS